MKALALQSSLLLAPSPLSHAHSAPVKSTINILGAFVLLFPLPECSSSPCILMAHSFKSLLKYRHTLHILQVWFQIIAVKQISQ